MTQSQTAFSFKSLDTEMLIAKRLAEHRCQPFEGTTDPELRKQRIRAAIIAARVDAVIFGKDAAGKPETYAEYFERHYGEPLIPKTTRKGK